MKNLIFSKESVLRICAFVFAIMCFQCVSAQYKDALALDLKGPVHHCKLYIEPVLSDDDDDTYMHEYVFAKNGALLSYDNNDVIDVKRDKNGLLYEFSIEDSDGTIDGHEYEYDMKNRVVKEKLTFDGGSTSDMEYKYVRSDDTGYISSYTCKFLGSGEVLYTTYNYVSKDPRGNWTRLYMTCGDSEDEKTRVITYYDENTSSSSSSWNTLKMKKLSLSYYGLAGKDGSEVNRYNESNDQYIELSNDGTLVWNNRGGDGDTSYNYKIDGNRLYIYAIGNSPAGNKWIDIVNISEGIIKTTDNLSTYRYFRY
jgi:hypothetical protein